jgi:putative DNA primase/helicase
MIQRFGLAVWPDISPDWENVDRYPNEEAREAAWAAFERLDKATAKDFGAEQHEYDRMPYLRFTEDAQAAYLPWREATERRVRNGSLPPAMESYVSKLPGLIARLALIIHLVDEGGGPVDQKAVLRALMWADYLEAHAVRLYGAGAEPGRRRGLFWQKSGPERLRTPSPPGRYAGTTGSA